MDPQSKLGDFKTQLVPEPEPEPSTVATLFGFLLCSTSIFNQLTLFSSKANASNLFLTQVYKHI